MRHPLFAFAPLLIATVACDAALNEPVEPGATQDVDALRVYLGNDFATLGLYTESSSLTPFERRPPRLRYVSVAGWGPRYDLVLVPAP